MTGGIDHFEVKVIPLGVGGKEMCRDLVAEDGDMANLRATPSLVILEEVVQKECQSVSRW